jgi:hypothetical protein
MESNPKSSGEAIRWTEVFQAVIPMFDPHLGQVLFSNLAFTSWFHVGVRRIPYEYSGRHHQLLLAIQS